MDQIYFWILILFFIILILDYSDKYFKKRKENFQDYANFSINDISDQKVPPYYEENRLYVYEPPYTTNAVNISNSNNLNFKNFGTNGIIPPFLKCSSCELQYNCTNFPYDADDKNMSVCQKCYTKTYCNANNEPVYAKSAGKPRVCRNLQ
jgi:cbb3-type cytochrome oxidase subunit 3